MNKETGLQWPEAKFYSRSYIKMERPILLQTCIIETITAMLIILEGTAITVRHCVIVLQNLMVLTLWKNK